MCDRNKQEIMARELCILWHKATKPMKRDYRKIPVSEYVDEHWEEFITRAEEILDMVDKHES